ncbi:hypothetical protein CYG48_21535 (plasmid) [Neorhizobium sp. SOG26]|uniref:hypothetical protein n=1 Tax=Neorhizobium sp. SOG26 TaxID=2060726 RepID=UPI000E58894F|nr:hypothetical protein [Neorhizobium sp. SOG26]AXV18321.1 hypothetical protein CYG48_21535 [Neorhizobium sp. SOG26]
MTEKITPGLNDRPRESSIAQSGPGLPDDSSSPIEVSEQQIERARDQLVGSNRETLKKEVQEQIEKPQRGSA